MARYLIEGGNRLSGTITVSGNKNSILPCMAAALLTEEVVTLKNVPQIADVSTFIEILVNLGVSVEVSDHVLKIQAKKLESTVLPKQQMGKLRASILLVGPLLAREGKVSFSHPGGDIIGKRSIESHLKGLRELGFEFKSRDRDYRGKTRSEKWEVREFFQDEPSVTATENLIMACALNISETVLKNCAMEPHVQDLCNLLIKMGVDIKGVGTTTLKIKGAKRLRGAEFTIGEDFVEVGTYAVAASLTGGQIKLLNCNLEETESVTLPLEKMGVKFSFEQDGVVISSKGLKAIPRLHVSPWPGFPTDLMSAMIVLATQSHGVSLLHDWMYESRMFFVDKLISMGAHITIADPHRVFVYGPSKLWGRELETPDIRAGMALVLAALAARGKSVINRAELIERGYEDVVGNLSRLGAKIERMD